MPHSLTDGLGEKTIWCVEFFLGVDKAKMAAEVSPFAAAAAGWGRGWPPHLFLLLLPFFLVAKLDAGCKNIKILLFHWLFDDGFLDGHGFFRL